MKVFCAAFMCLQSGFVFFWRKDFDAKAAHKMLVKLTIGHYNNTYNDFTYEDSTYEQTELCFFSSYSASNISIYCYKRSHFEVKSVISKVLYKKCFICLSYK
jgi:hypothetical protein